MKKHLFILEMANNHMGDVEHGLRLIRTFADVCKPFPFRFAFKMQYRQLDTFIHPDFAGRMDIKYVKRFSETRLSREETQALVEECRKCGFETMCTPFDEESVDVIEEDRFDIIKIASCSFTDWPLLERVVKTDMPIIASTAGADQESIDNVVSFLQHRKKKFTLMHCVGEYPTLTEHSNLGQIDFLRSRYPHVEIGYSTHEDPAETMGVAMAVAKGCTTFEKHVALPTEKYAANAYSATPEQVEAWLKAAQKAIAMDGVRNGRISPTEEEAKALHSLRRGVFARRDIEEGEVIGTDAVFMAIPTTEGHVTANDWSKYTRYIASRKIRKNEPILFSNTRQESMREKVWDIVQRVKSLLKEGNIVVPGQTELEISHHYGLENFDKTGMAMITVVNRDYCKKLIVVLPGQSHPEQFHEKKEETFHILHGALTMRLNGTEREYRAGDVVTVERGVKHEFSSKTGAVFEEISSTHFKDDSFYTDSRITQNPNRKTFLSYWWN